MKEVFEITKEMKEHLIRKIGQDKGDSPERIERMVNLFCNNPTMNPRIQFVYQDENEETDICPDCGSEEVYYTNTDDLTQYICTVCGYNTEDEVEDGLEAEY